MEYSDRYSSVSIECREDECRERRKVELERGGGRGGGGEGGTGTRPSATHYVVPAICPLHSDKDPEKRFPRAFTRISSSSSRRGRAGGGGQARQDVAKRGEARRGEARRGEARRGSGRASRLEKDSKGARRVHRRGLPVIIMTKARGKHPFNLLAYRQRRLRTTYHTPPTTPAMDRL